MDSSPHTTLVLIDDHSLVRSGLKALIERDPSFRVVGEAGNATEALQVVKAQRPKMAVLDYALPGANGVNIAHMLLEDHPELKILMVTGNPDMAFVPEAMGIGVLGFLRKESNADQLSEALHTLLLGKVYLCSDAATAVAQSVRAAASPEGKDPSMLSEREQQVLKWVAEGFRNKEIADKLSVSVKSVETYRARIMRKLGCNSSAELVRHAVKLGL